MRSDRRQRWVGATVVRDGRLLVLAWVALLLGGAEPPLAPLPVADAALEAALDALGRGDSAPFLALRSDLFQRPPVIPSPGDPALARPWTDRLPASLAAAPPAARAAALLKLAEIVRTLARDTSLPPAFVARRCLPDPGAVTTLKATADVAFDRGRFGEFLAADEALHFLPDAAIDPARSVVALSLLASADRARSSAPPGVPEPLPPQVNATIDAASAAPGAGLEVVAGWLLARDPWGGVTWQRRLDEDAEVVTGSDTAVIATGAQLQLVAHGGTLAWARPLAAGERALSVGPTGVWSMVGGTVVCTDHGGSERARAALPGPPCGSPLVHWATSLWLTPRELVLVTGSTVQARLRHGLAAGPGWRLAEDRDGLLVGAPDGATWRVPPLAAQIAAAPPAARASLLVRACRWDEVLALLAADPALAASAAGRAAGLAAHLARGFPAAAAAQVAELAADDGERLLVAWRMGLVEGVAPNTAPASLLTLLGACPGIELPDRPADFAAEPPAWAHAITARAALRWLTAPVPTWPEEVDPAIPLTATGEALPVAPLPHLAFSAGGTGTELLAAAADGAPLWRNRWSALPVPSGAPARSVAVRDDVLIVGEGSGRLIVVEPLRGRRLGSVDLADADAEPATCAVAGHDARGGLRVALLQPLGVGTRLVLASDVEGERVRALPVPGRWLVAAPGGKVLVGLADGTGLLVAGAEGTWRPVVLPPPLATAPAQVPTAEARGVWTGGCCITGGREVEPLPVYHRALVLDAGRQIALARDGPRRDLSSLID